MQKYREKLNKESRNRMDEKDIEFSNHTKTLKKTLDTQK